MNASERASKYVAALKGENERLRMVIERAADDCEAAAKGSPVNARSALQMVAERLFEALETKP